MNGLEFRDRANRVMERVAPDTFDLLSSRHPAYLLDRPGVLVAGQGPACAVPITDSGSLDTAAEEPDDTGGFC